MITSSALVPGCSDDCGPAGASDTGLLASSADAQLTFGHLAAGANNDCPAADAPMGVISLTITGMQIGGMGLVTFCVPRPDLLGMTQQSLGNEVKVVDVNASDANGCTYMLDTSRPPTGTAKATGLCNNGTDKKGFALTITGAVSLLRTCNGTTDSIAVQLSGTTAVAAM